MQLAPISPRQPPFGHLIRPEISILFVKAATQITCSGVVSLSLLSKRIFTGNALKGKNGVCSCWHLLTKSTYISLTQVQQRRREATLGKVGKLSRPSQKYLLSGICQRSSVRATNLRYFWMLRRKTDYIKRDSTFQSANMKQKSCRGSSWTTSVIASLPSLVFPCLHAPLLVVKQEQP